METGGWERNSPLNTHSKGPTPTSWIVALKNSRSKVFKIHKLKDQNEK
jgi:hypothetical protein